MKHFLPRSLSAARLAVFLLGIGALTGCATAPSEDKLVADLLQANRDYDAALIAGDGPALDRLYRNEFIYIGPEAGARNKTEQIRALTSGEVDLLEGRSDEVHVERYGHTAVVTGRFQGRVRVKTEEFSFRERYSTVWVHEGTWRLALEHGSVIKTP